MKGKLGRVNQTRDFLLAKDLGQVQNLLRIGRLCNAPASLQHLNIAQPEAARCAARLLARAQAQAK